MAEDIAAVPIGNSGGSRYAVDVTPERRRVMRVTESGEELISDYQTLFTLSQEIRQMSDQLAGVKQVGKPVDEMADDDDTDAQKNFLMQAWQALVMYVSTCDDEDQQAAVQALKMVTNLMNDTDEPNQPATTGAFNVTTMANLDVAANTFECPQDKRTFSTEAGLINHLKTVHAQREKQTHLTPEN